jgi:hypothetical protein
MVYARQPSPVLLPDVHILNRHAALEVQQRAGHQILSQE